MESSARRLEGRLHTHALWIWTEGTSTTLWVFSTLKACMPLWWVIQATVNSVPETFPRRFQCCHQWLVLFPGSKLTQVIISGVTFSASPWTITDVVSGLHSLGSSSTFVLTSKAISRSCLVLWVCWGPSWQWCLCAPVTVDYKLAPLIWMLCFQSGKLVTRMFQKIQDLIDDKEALVFVLIDEVCTQIANLWSLSLGQLCCKLSLWIFSWCPMQEHI